MKNLFTTEIENALVQIIDNNDFKFRKAKTGSLKVVLKNNYYTQKKRPDLFDTTNNNMVLTIGKSIVNGKEVYTFRVSGPSYWTWSIKNPWVTPIGLKHWNDNLEDVLKYLNTYLNKKKLERDY